MVGLLAKDELNDKEFGRKRDSIPAFVWIDLGKPLKSTSGESVFRPTFEGAFDECKLETLSLLSNGYPELFPRGQSGPVVKPFTSIWRRGQKGGAIPPILHMSSWRGA
jgi:hypothetical protein